MVGPKAPPPAPPPEGEGSTNPRPGLPPFPSGGGTGWGDGSRTDVIRLAGVKLIPDLTGALYVPDARTLIAADLHFEKGTSRRRAGVHLPPYDTRSTLGLLTVAVARWQPERLILLGDSFHDDDAPRRLDAADLAGIRALGEATDVVWITGNHDPCLEADLPGTVASEVWLGDLVLRHEPQHDAVAEIAGHLHPVAAVLRRGRRLRCRCFASSQQRLVMPAFGAYTGGLSVLASPFAPLFPERRFTAWLIGRGGLHRFPGTALLA